VYCWSMSGSGNPQVMKLFLATPPSALTSILESRDRGQACSQNGLLFIQ
jgi:hypothetical protein